MKRVPWDKVRNVGTSAFLAERHMWNSSTIPLPTPTQSRSSKSSSLRVFHICTCSIDHFLPVFAWSHLNFYTALTPLTHILQQRGISALSVGWTCFAKTVKSMRKNQQTWSERTATIILNKVYCPGVWPREGSFNHLCSLAPLTYGNSSMEKMLLTILFTILPQASLKYT